MYSLIEGKLAAAAVVHVASGDILRAAQAVFADVDLLELAGGGGNSRNLPRPTLTLTALAVRRAG